MKTKILLLIIAIFFIFQIARESIIWALITAVLLFILACWLHKEPKDNAATAAREQRELIEKGGVK
jgi:amino acid permease